MSKSIPAPGVRTSLRASANPGRRVRDRATHGLTGSVTRRVRSHPARKASAVDFHSSSRTPVPIP
jgi:hypothetical protein